MRTTNSPRPLVLVGDSAFAEIAYEYFTHDSEHDVVAFAVERAYLSRDSLFGVPVVPLEEVGERFAPAEHSFYAANVYTQGNRLRARMYEHMKGAGYRAASYISPRAFVWRNVEVGEHAFIFEDNVVQPFVRIGRDVVLWSGNHIGHHSTVGDHTFVASHVVVSGFVNVGAYCFAGVNASIANNVNVGDRCVLGAGAIVLGDVPEGTTVVGTHKRQKEEPKA